FHDDGVLGRKARCARLRREQFCESLCRHGLHRKRRDKKFPGCRLTLFEFCLERLEHCAERLTRNSVSHWAIASPKRHPCAPRRRAANENRIRANAHDTEHPQSKAEPIARSTLVNELFVEFADRLAAVGIEHSIQSPGGNRSAGSASDPPRSLRC